MSYISFDQFKTDFEQFQLLGQGNCASVQLIRDRRTGDKYALKRILLKSIAQIATCFGQMQILKSLQDQAIPKIYYYFTHQFFVSEDTKLPYLCIIIEYCQESLKQEIQRIKNKKMKPYSAEEIWKFLKEMVRVFSMMQKKNILHRDIKPANILIKKIGQKEKVYKVCDFGYAICLSKYSDQSITGTLQYVSPRIKHKFQNEKLFIPGVNAKDDVYSLGITVLEMIYHITLEKHQITKRMFKELEKYFSSHVSKILQNMLEQDEFDRWDFIELQKQINKLDKFKKSTTIDLQNSMMDQKEEGQLSQEISQNQIKSNSQIKKIQSSNIEVQTELSNINEMIDSSSKVLQKNFFKKKIYQDCDETFYAQNSLEKPILGTKKVCFLRETKLNFQGQINCMLKISDFLIFGMIDTLGVISLKEKEVPKIYILRPNFKGDLGHKFVIIDLICKNQTFAVIGSSNFFIYCSASDLIKEISSMMVMHDEQMRLKVLKQVMRPNILSRDGRDRNLPRMFQKQIDFFSVYICPSTISCIQVASGIFKGNKNLTLIGGSDGKISLYNSQELISDNSPILKMKIFQNYLIYSNFDGVIKRLQFLGQKLQSSPKYRAKTYSAGSPIVHFQLMAQENAQENKKVDEDTRKIVPFVKIFTYEGKQIVLNRDMGLISLNVASVKEIHQCCQTVCNWDLKKQETSNLIITERSLISNEPHGGKIKRHTCYVTKQGVLYDSNLNKKIHNIGILNPSSIYVDQDYIIAASYDGQVRIHYTETVEKESFQKEKLGSVFNGKQSQPPHQDKWTKRDNQSKVQSQKNEHPASSRRTDMKESQQSSNSRAYFQEVKQRNLRNMGNSIKARH